MMNLLRNFQIKSIQPRIAFWGGFCLLLVSASLISYAIITVRGNALEAAEREASAIAESKAVSIEPAPTINSIVDSSFITCIAKLDQRLIMLLVLQPVLIDEEQFSLQAA
jgi:hypothetical protein